MKPFTIVFAAFWNLNQCTFNYTDSCASRKFCVMCICDLWLSNAKRAPNKWDFYDARSIFAISSHFSRFRVLLRFVSLCLTIHYKSKSTRSTGPELFELTGEPNEEQGKEWEPIDPLDVITDQKDLETQVRQKLRAHLPPLCFSFAFQRSRSNRNGIVNISANNHNDWVSEWTITSENEIGQIWSRLEISKQSGFPWTLTCPTTLSTNLSTNLYINLSTNLSTNLYINLYTNLSTNLSNQPTSFFSLGRDIPPFSSDRTNCSFSFNWTRRQWQTRVLVVYILVLVLVVYILVSVLVLVVSILFVILLSNEQIALGPRYIHSVLVVKSQLHSIVQFVRCERDTRKNWWVLVAFAKAFFAFAHCVGWCSVQMGNILALVSYSCVHC